MRYITLTPSNVGSAIPLAGYGWMKEKVILSAHRDPSYHQVDVAELVDALGLGSSRLICEGSSPFIDT